MGKSKVVKTETQRERFAPGMKGHKSARIEIRCSAEVRALAEALVQTGPCEDSLSELFRRLVKAEGNRQSHFASVARALSRVE